MNALVRVLGEAYQYDPARVELALAYLKKRFFEKKLSHLPPQEAERAWLNYEPKFRKAIMAGDKELLSKIRIGWEGSYDKDHLPWVRESAVHRVIGT